MKKVLNFVSGSLFLFLSYLALTMIQKENSFAYLMVVVSVLFFIMTIVFYIPILSTPVRKPVEIMMRTICGILGVVLFYIAIKQSMECQFNTPSIIRAAVLIIEALYFGNLTTPNFYNIVSDMVNTVYGMEETIVDLYEKYRSVNTPYGYPWVGTVNTISDECLIYGPATNDSFIYCYYALGVFTISVSDNISLISSNYDLESHRLLNEYEGKEPKIIRVQNVLAMLYPKMYRDMFLHYVKTGEKKWVSQNFDLEIEKNVYVFDQRFAIKKQKYHLLNQDGRQIFEVNSNLFRRSFTLTYTPTGEEIFQTTRRLLPILIKYDLYKDGSRYGALRKRTNYCQDFYRMETIDGQFEVHKMSGTISGNFVASLNGKVIGIISQEINTENRKGSFYNYWMVVFDDKYIALLTMLVIIIQREKIREDHT